jgi:alanine racemase
LIAAATVTPPVSPLPTFYRPCWIEIQTSALRANWKALRSKLSKNVQVLAVVKANGYGIGLLHVAKVAVEEGAQYLGVSSVEEGIQLRQAGFSVPILILGSLFPFESFTLLFDHRLTPTIASVEAAQALQRLATERGKVLPVHLKVDSGFGRIGVSLSSAAAFIEKVAAMKGLSIEGIYTHFASSDVDPDYTLEQCRAFQAIMKAVKGKGIEPRWVHLANSSAILRFPETHGNLVRPGIACYGIPPYPGAEKDVALEPVLTWKSRIIYLKTVPSGTSVGYARTWKATRQTRIATLAVGYADGLPRLLTNKGHVLIGGSKAPIIGRVTMDMTMVDVTGLRPCRIGDEAVLLGHQGPEEITVSQIAEWAQTNPYEILCGLGPRVPRVIIHE